MKRLTLQQEIEIAEGNIKGLLHFQAFHEDNEEVQMALLEWAKELKRLKGLAEVKTHKNGFEYTEKVTVRGRDRYLLNGEIVALQCIACKDAFELGGFSKNKKGVAGKYSQCKNCDRKQTSQWTKNNPERKQAQNKRNSKRWYNDNKAHKLATHHNWRAEQLSLKATLTSEMIEELSWSRQGRCFLTGRADVELDIDHALPLSRGGGSTLGNLILIDARLNQMKGQQTLIEFLERPEVQAIVDPAHVEETLRMLANYNSMRVQAYELHVEQVAEKADRERKKERQKLKKQLKVIK
ncbi:hypothetical protein LG298_07460 [Cytobacillus firmus]|uniref:HNH endonuclease domain-containing protein n=1 Tax=Cytobacillus firmus TaxID=1399 RepID=UPI00384EB71E